jgi:hypothetical protein
MSTRASIRFVTAALLFASAASLEAQGSLGVQGFGYPPGQLSTRAASTGGAIAEIDFMSPLNPAALLNFGVTTLYFQADPEYRRVTVGGADARTSVARFPLIAGGFAIGSRWAGGVAFSTLADRTWSTTLQSIEQIGGDTASATSTYRSEGAINDARVGVAYAPLSWMRVGVGLHAISGRNRVVVERDFADTNFAFFRDTSTISYGGNAVSAGLEARIPRIASFALSLRKGGRMSAESSAGDSVIGRAHVPDRIGISAAYIGITGSTIAIRASQDRWSQLEGLGSSRVQPRDTWDIGVGGDIAGPRFGNRVVMLRAGARWRDLPFAVVGGDGSADVRAKERALSAGVGTLFANGRAGFDLGVTRASRSADVDASERAWILSVGLTVRP